MSDAEQPVSEHEVLPPRLPAGDDSARAEVPHLAPGMTDPNSIVSRLVAAVLTGDTSGLEVARGAAVTNRDRQRIELTEALLAGEAERFDVLVRDHLADFPDDSLACWLAGQSATADQPPIPASPRPPTRPRKELR